LKSPFKERLSQAFARFFMRVGLENDDEIKISYDDWKYKKLVDVLKKSYDNAVAQYEEVTLFYLTQDTQSTNMQFRGGYVETERLTETVSQHKFTIEITKDRDVKSTGATDKSFKGWIKKLSRKGYKSEFSDEGDKWIGSKVEGDYTSTVAIFKRQPYTTHENYPWFPEINFHHIIVDFIDEH